MQEIELKFQIPQAALAAVRTELLHLSGGQMANLALRAAYFDTPARHLAAARMALRVRQEDESWVQTLKAGGTNTMMRLEDNHPATAPQAGQAIQADLSRHGPQARQALAQVLGWHPEQDPKGAQAGLTELYRTDITRTRVQLTVGRGSPHEGVVELALDLGHIHAGGLSVPVCELEIESLSGHPMAVINVGRDWVRRHGLWLDTQTKAHRGDRLARLAAGQAQDNGPPTLGRPARLPADATLDQAWRAGVESCLEQVCANMSELASQAPADVQPCLYEWRRGLRRLHALGKLLRGSGLPCPFEAMNAAATLARQLGHWRDPHALAWLPARLASLGGPELPWPPLPATHGPASCAIDLARSAAASELCLDLLAALLQPHAEDGAAAQPFRPWLRHRLKQWHARILGMAPSYKALSAKAQHRLRQRARRLRDMNELWAPLWPAKALAGHQAALGALLRRLGALHDEQVALGWYQQAATKEPRALFACGWLLARQGLLRRKARPALQDWLALKTPW